MVVVTGLKVLADFVVIEIVEDTDPYLALLGVDWAFNVGGVINLKKCSMAFEKNGTRVIVPLDPTEDEEIDHIYRMTAQDKDQDDPTTSGAFN